MKLSIIVPVYNAEKYLDRTISNILEQTFTDFELLLIDDGSKDSSGKICDQWKKKDTRVKVIHQNNTGVGGARNTGLDAAQGEYIGFVDNDDFIHPQMYEILISVAEKENADIVMSIEKKIRETDKITFENYQISNLKYIELSFEAMIKGLFSNASEEGPYIHIWNKIYRNTLVSAIRFLDKSTEDAIFNCFVYGKTNKMVMIDNSISLYYWISRYSSLSHNLFTGYYAGYVDSYFGLSKKMLKEYPEYSHYALEKTLKIFLSVRYAFRYMNNKNEINKKIKEYYRVLKKPFYNSKKIRKSIKAIVGFFYYFPFAYTVFKLINDPTLIKWERAQRKTMKQKNAKKIFFGNLFC